MPTRIRMRERRKCYKLATDQKVGARQTYFLLVFLLLMNYNVYIAVNKKIKL